jgi:hypothetical protein
VLGQIVDTPPALEEQDGRNMLRHYNGEADWTCRVHEGGIPLTELALPIQHGKWRDELAATKQIQKRGAA